MRIKSISDLGRGDIIRHVGSGNSLVVMSTYDDFAIAADITMVSNPSEWILVHENPHEEVDGDVPWMDGSYPRGATIRPSKITKPGQLCRKCDAPVAKTIPRRRRRKPNSKYYFEWYLKCPNVDCKTIYMVESAKRFYEDQGEIR